MKTVTLGRLARTMPQADPKRLLVLLRNPVDCDFWKLRAMKVITQDVSHVIFWILAWNRIESRVV